MERSSLVTVITIVALVGSLAGYYLYETEVAPEVLTGVWQVREDLSTVGVEDGEITGYWMFELTVDTRDEIKFTIENLSEDVNVAGLPPGTEIRSGAEISVIFEPDGPPYISGPVYRMGYVYDDYGYQTPGGWHRIWQFWVLGYPEWHVDGRHAPYKITIEKDDYPIFGPQTYVSGIRQGWDSGTVIELPFDMEVYQFGQLTNGLVIPTEKYAYVYIEEPDVEVGAVWEELKMLGELQDRLRAGYYNTCTPALFKDTFNYWDEVSSGATIDRCSEWEPTPDALTDFPGILTELVMGVQGVPSGVTRFTEGAPSLWREQPEHDIDTSWGSQPSDSFVSDPSTMTAIRALPAASVMATLLLKVPADMFDSWVYIPPYGTPVIVDKFFPDATDGQRNLASIDVRNDGPSGDTFVADLTCSGVTWESTPGRIYIPAGEIRTFQWIASRPISEEEEYTLDWSAEVTAIWSGLTDTDSGTWTWHGGGGPQPGYGDVTGEVTTAAGIPIQHAMASCGGKMDLVDQSGMFYIAQIGAGSQTLSVTASGYATVTTDVYINDGQTTNAGRIVLYEAEEEGFPWIWVVVGAVVAVIIVIILYYFKKRKRRD